MPAVWKKEFSLSFQFWKLSWIHNYITELWFPEGKAKGFKTKQHCKWSPSPSCPLTEDGLPVTGPVVNTTNLLPHKWSYLVKVTTMKRAQAQGHCAMNPGSTVAISYDTTGSHKVLGPNTAAAAATINCNLPSLAATIKGPSPAYTIQLHLSQ